MANKEHLEILEKGIEEWNEWREQNPKIEPDLSGALLQYKNLWTINLNNANLYGAVLNGADLSYANLKQIKLRNANCLKTNFTNSDLEKADMFDCDLQNSNFTEANLKDADLSFSKLNGVDFTNSNLCQANLYETYLDGAVFFSTILDKTNFDLSYLRLTAFILTDLSKAKKLNSTKVVNTCSIDFQTLQNSRNLSKEFLMKIGLPENYINYLPDFYDSSPIRLFPVFLSHSWANKNFARKLYDALIEKGVLVWYDEKKLRAGDKIYEGLTKAINVYDKMILVCSKESLEESWWVDEEMNRIFKKERMYLKEQRKNVSLLIPITIDDHIFKWEGAKGESIRDKVIGDFSEWQDDVKFKKALNELIEALNVDRGEENITSFL